MKKLTKEEFIEKAIRVQGKIYDYSLTEYKLANKKIIIICKIHGEFLQTPNKHLMGRGCPDCAVLKQIEYANLIRSNTEEFIQKSKIEHHNFYNYDLVEYKNNYTEVKIICPIHGEFLQKPKGHLIGQGCSKCGFEKMRKLNKSNTEEFIEKANKIHNNFYNYDLVIYINNREKVKIICPIHGEFLQKPNHHLSGSRCSNCVRDKKPSTEKFIKKAIKIHDEKYDYSLINYLNANDKIIIICKIHGNFLQTPNKHLRGRGCPDCGGSKKLTKENFIERANIKHNNFYKYDEVEYKNISTKVKIICPEHSEFFQKPNHHLNGNGCPDCAKSGVSKKETLWLDSLDILPKNRNISLPGIGRKRVDGFNPSTNTAYEFHGDWWHGNPEIYDPDKINSRTKNTYGSLYQKTLEKERLIKYAGYNLVVMWENEWNKL